MFVTHILWGIANNFKKINCVKIFFTIYTLFTYCEQLKMATVIPTVLRTLSTVCHQLMRPTCSNGRLFWLGVIVQYIWVHSKKLAF
jgi:hypothetical protein